MMLRSFFFFISLFFFNQPVDAFSGSTKETSIKADIEDDRKDLHRYLECAANEKIDIKHQSTCQIILADFYLSGIGTEKNPEASMKWLQRAVANNYDQAQFMMGSAYKMGIVVEKNDALAAQWFAISAEQGYWRARYALAEMYRDGRGVRQSNSEAYARFAFVDTKESWAEMAKLKKVMSQDELSQACQRLALMRGVNTSVCRTKYGMPSGYETPATVTKP
jgi:TPR repeat protein